MELIYLSPSSSVIPAGSKTYRHAPPCCMRKAVGKLKTHSLHQGVIKVTKGQLTPINEIQATKGICPGLNQPSDNFSFLNL